jgi:hypothetical protein
MIVPAISQTTTASLVRDKVPRLKAHGPSDRIPKPRNSPPHPVKYRYAPAMAASTVMVGGQLPAQTHVPGAQSGTGREPVPGSAEPQSSLLQKLGIAEARGDTTTNAREPALSRLSFGWRIAGLLTCLAFRVIDSRDEIHVGRGNIVEEPGSSNGFHQDRCGSFQ